MTADALSTTTLAIYAILSVPVLFYLVRHGKPGLLGWIYLLAFCTLRIVGGAMSLNTNSDSGGGTSSSSSASIIANIGLSPLLLATSGILHEARSKTAAYGKARDKNTEWLIVLVFHAVVAPGVALLAAGASGLQKAAAATNNNNNQDLVLVCVGIALLVGAWVMLCVGTALSFLPFRRQRQQKKNRENKVTDIGPAASVHRNGTKLLWGVAAALPLIGTRVLYSLVALTTRRPYLNPSTGALAVRVVLAFLPELMACIILIAAGLLTMPQRAASR